jgi:hypothetical protein
MLNFNNNNYSLTKVHVGDFVASFKFYALKKTKKKPNFIAFCLYNVSMRGSLYVCVCVCKPFRFNVLIKQFVKMQINLEN